MSVTVAIEVPEEALSILRRSPEEFAQALRLAAAVQWYELGRITQAKAAGLAGLSRQAFLEALADFEVSPFRETAEEPEASLE